MCVPCKSDLTHTYIHTSDTPTCVTDKEFFLETQLFEERTIQCNVHAEPNEVLFFWEFNSTFVTNDVDIVDNLRNQPSPLSPMMAITNSGLRSELRFIPRSVADYGVLYCYAQNRIGQQKKPCIFHIVKSGKP